MNRSQRPQAQCGLMMVSTCWLPAMAVLGSSRQAHVIGQTLAHVPDAFENAFGEAEFETGLKAHVDRQWSSPCTQLPSPWEELSFRLSQSSEC